MKIINKLGTSSTFQNIIEKIDIKSKKNCNLNVKFSCSDYPFLQFIIYN